MIKDVIHIPLQSIPESLEILNINKHYVLVCRSGSRSYAAALYLQKLGYQVSNSSRWHACMARRMVIKRLLHLLS